MVPTSCDGKVAFCQVDDEPKVCAFSVVSDKVWMYKNDDEH